MKKTIEELALEEADKTLFGQWPLRLTCPKTTLIEFASRLIAAWQAECAEPVARVNHNLRSSIEWFVDYAELPQGEKLFLAPQPAIPESMCLVSTGFRDTVLNQRGMLAENGMTGDQINDVLHEFDAAQGEQK